jgi:hypothetical protein
MHPIQRLRAACMSTRSVLLITYLRVLATRKEPGDLFAYFVMMDLCQESMPSGPLLACHSASESAKSGQILRAALSTQ